MKNVNLYNRLFALPAVLSLIVFLNLFFFVCPAYSSSCDKALTYRIGKVDERFGITRSEFSWLVKKAAEMWSAPYSRDLLEEASDGRILIEMMYDYRQDATENMKRLDTNVGADLRSYTGLREEYDKLQRDYKRKEKELEAASAEYRRMVHALQEESAAALRSGRVSEETHRRLQEARAEVNAVQAGLQKRQEELNEIALRGNQLVPLLNDVAKKQRVNIDNYHKERGRLGDGFEKGIYHRRDKSITVYQFRDKDNLVQLLAHEFGHALGLRHVDDPRALMYPWDTGRKIMRLSPTDIDALRAKCRK